MESLKLEAARMFKRVDRCILEYKDRNNISADICLEFLISVFLDVYDTNSIKNASELKVSNSDDFLSDMHSFLPVFSALCEMKEREVLNFIRAKPEKFHALETTMQEDKKILAGISADIERLKKETAAEKENFLAQKGEKESQIEELNNKNSKLRDELDSLNAQVEKNTALRAETESGIADKKERIHEFEEWEKGLDKETKQRLEEHGRISARVQTYVNIWNAESNQSFVKNTLFRDNPLSDVKDLKDIFRWFDDMNKAIQEGLKEYQEKLKLVIEESQKLTQTQ
jgi:septal ring factor EnvC (AmiA/AmiB activator)